MQKEAELTKQETVRKTLLQKILAFTAKMKCFFLSFHLSLFFFHFQWQIRILKQGIANDEREINPLPNYYDEVTVVKKLAQELHKS